MKKTFPSTILILFLLVLNSCSKESTENTNTIVGSWELREIIGGFRGNQPQTNYAPGNGNLWEMSESAYQFYQNHVLMEQGTFVKGRDSSSATGKLTDFLLLSSNEKLYFEISKDTLTFYSEELVYDGTIDKYVRIPTVHNR